MFKTYLLIACFVISYCSVNAQLIKDYIPMESQGEIPEEFNTPIKNRYSNAVKELSKDTKRKTKRDQKDFLLESHNELDLYFKSGRVVFNHEIGAYINKVAEVTLESEGAKAKSVMFYPIKYDYSNAFAFNEGVVFVNIGLIARCNNEAELAFILGHEYGHYIKRHSIKYNTELKKAARGEEAYRKKNVDDRRALMSRNSKKNEIEADLYGYKLLKNSKYNPYSAVSALSGLAEANTVPGIDRFEKSVIEKGYVRIPQQYLLENLSDTIAKKEKKKEENSEDEEPDSSFTHPSIDERINEVGNVLIPKDTVSKAYFIVGRSEFERVREMCRFEMCRIYLLQNNIDNAFCLISSLLQKYPNNAYLQRMMAVTLFRVAKAANEGRLAKVIPLYNKVNEELQETNYMLRKLHKEELTLIALRYAWNVHVAQPTVSESEHISSELLKMYTSNFKQNLALFADAVNFNDSTVEKLYLPDKPTDLTDAEPSKKKRKKKVIKGNSGYRFERSLSFYALTDLKNDEKFKEAFKEAAREAKKSDKYGRGEDDEDSEDSETATKNTPKSKVKKKDDKYVIGKSEERVYIDSIILLEPEFDLIDTRKRVSRDYVANDEKEIELRKQIIECSDRAGVGITLMNVNSIEANDVQKFNDYCVLKEFTYEAFNQYEHPNLPTDFGRLKEIGDRYSTRYVTVLVNRNFIIKTPGKNYMWASILSVFVPYVGVPFLVSCFFPKKQYVYILGVVDLQTGKFVYGNVLSFNRKERTDLFQSQFYATLVQLKGKRKR